MINIVIGYDPSTKEFKAYEPTTDTLFITTSLGETFLKLDEYLKQKGLITADILSSLDISYHIDSYTLFGLVENNANLLKRLNQSPSGFTTSSQRFGISPTQGSYAERKKREQFLSGGNKGGKGYKKNRGGGTFSKSSFNNSNKKFGGN